MTIKTGIAATLLLSAALLGAALAPRPAAQAAASAAPPAPTFAKDVAPILYQNCVSCHRPGQVAPFSLQTYGDAAPRARQIADVTQSRYMPPWKAAPGYGRFHDERTLSAGQIATLKAWAAHDAPQGNKADLPPAPHFASDWQIGTPDLVVKMPRAFTIRADGPDVYRCFVVSLPPEARPYVTALEFRPSNHRVVHHAILYLDHSGVARKKEAASGGVGFESFGGPGFLPSGILGAWVPGTVPQALPQGVARALLAGSDLVIQMHFHPTGKVETEQSEVALQFAKTPPRRILAGILQGTFALNIPPGDAHYVARDSFVVPINCEAVSIQPHAHWLCKDMRVTATLPGGKREPMIWIKDWDFNWQGAYQYARPVHLPKGTRLDMTYVYDNSASNFRNPSTPPRRVQFGEQTTDEMALNGIEVIADNEADLPILRRAVGAHLLAQVMLARAADPNVNPGR